MGSGKVSTPRFLEASVNFRQIMSAWIQNCRTPCMYLLCMVGQILQVLTTPCFVKFTTPPTDPEMALHLAEWRAGWDMIGHE